MILLTSSRDIHAVYERFFYPRTENIDFIVLKACVRRDIYLSAEVITTEIRETHSSTSAAVGTQQLPSKFLLIHQSSNHFTLLRVIIQDTGNVVTWILNNDKVNWSSSVSIVTGIRAGPPRHSASISERDMNLFCSPKCRLTLGHTQPHVEWVRSVGESGRSLKLTATSI